MDNPQTPTVEQQCAEQATSALQGQQRIEKLARDVAASLDQAQRSQDPSRRQASLDQADELMIKLRAELQQNEGTMSKCARSCRELSR